MINEQRGFTLFESMLSLLILSMIISLGMAIFNITGQNNRSNENTEALMFIQELESKKHDFKLISVNETKLKLYSKTEEKTYWLGQYKNMLRFTPGHMPILSNVQYCHFKLNKGLIKIHLKVNQNSYQSEVYIGS